MKHYISVCAEPGNRCQEAGKVELEEAMRFLSTPDLAGVEKSDCVLVFNGYSGTKERYLRNEGELDRFSTIFIDCDNPESDPDAMAKFEDAMQGYDYWLYETFSSTPESPKFRAIIPMDEELEWSKYAKSAVFHTFSKFADPKASWFYSPTSNRLGTVRHHETGRLFPARVVKKRVDDIRRKEEVQSAKSSKFALWNAIYGKERNPDGWRFLPSVKKCLEGLTKGERDDSLNKACFAMNKNGYRSNIPEFLDEVDVPNDMKSKFRGRYR